MLRKIRSLFTGEEAPPPPPLMSFQPYKDPEANIEYNRLFCDNPELFRPVVKPERVWKTIFARQPVIDALKSIADDHRVETRTRLLAFNALRRQGVNNEQKVLGAIIEIGAEEGIEILAVYNDLRAFYINSKGRILNWGNNSPGAGINEKIQNIITISQKIIGKATAWTQPRPAPPVNGDFRITFLATDAVYLGEGKLATITADPVAAALIRKAGEIMTALNKHARQNIITTPGTDPPADTENPPQKYPLKSTRGATSDLDILKITVHQAGEIRIGNKIVTMREAESQLSLLAAKKGVVWFYREPGRNPPAPEATAIIKLAIKYKVPVSLSTKPDFSDTIDDNGKSIPRV